MDGFSEKKFCSRWGWRLSPPTVSPWLQCAAFALMAVYIWVLPIAHTIAVRHTAFFLLVLLTLWLGWRGALKLRLPLLWPWLIYAGVALLSLVYALDPAYSQGEIKSEIGYGMLVLLLAATWVRDLDALSNLLGVLIGGAIIMIASALMNGFILKPFWEQAVLEVASLYSGVGTFSTYLIMVLPLIIAYLLLLPRDATLRRWSLITLVAGGVLALYLTGNRAGLLALALEGLIALGFVCLRCRPRIGWKMMVAITISALVLAGGIASLFSQRPLGTDPRGEIWRIALHDIQAQPLAGGGFGTRAFKLRNPDYVLTHPLHGHAHNMVLNKGVQMGVPGMLAFAALWLALLYRLWPGHPAVARRDEWVYAVAATSMVGGMVLKNMSDDFFTNDMALLFWLLCGAVLGARAERQR